MQDFKTGGYCPLCLKTTNNCDCVKKQLNSISIVSNGVKPLVSRRLINTYIVVLKCDHPMIDDETVKLHELENGQWYKEDWKGRLSPFNAEVALKLVNGG